MSFLPFYFELILQSLPARGAWIETSVPSWLGPPYESLPARGAWIETSNCLNYTFSPSRSPHGERGLKLEAAVKGEEINVAPRTGSVD